MARVAQEFYCTKSGGGCGGYFLANINMDLNGVHEIVCPSCKHKHQRYVNNGVIQEQGRNGSPVDEIYPTISSYRKTPYTSEMMQRAKDNHPKERDCVVIAKDGKLQTEAIEIKELWTRSYGGRI